ncbi:interleukin 17 receptor A1a isoform X2 [Engraulis encrasicolus]|uniref:interleukin 17 receptor A1a isoform X2 n=1 Tax=Engraulis encrasicolus TaxID=184585 RepID=UPI002FCE883C
MVYNIPCQTNSATMFLSSLFFMLISGIYGLEILKLPRNCSQPELSCRVETDNCLDEVWLTDSMYTPTSPRDLEVKVDVSKDANGDLHPVILAQWKARDDGSIRFLKGAELSVLHLGTNQRICLKYIFLEKFPRMKKNISELWSFTSDPVIVVPDEQYHVAVASLPKPNYLHSYDKVEQRIPVKGCDDPQIQRAKICVDRGYQWHPNISLSKAEGQGTVTLGFVPAELRSDPYRVTLQCGKSKSDPQDVSKVTNATRLTVIYDLAKFPSYCCEFTVQIQPFFQACANDCPRRKQSFNICPVTPSPPPPKPEKSLMFIAIVAGLVFTCTLAFCSAWVYLHRKTSQKGKILPHFLAPVTPLPASQPTFKPRTILIIYSQDHRLYTDIVLKLCAFLQAKCATEVVVDLLDSTWLGTVGRLPWLEQQRRRIDKVLVLCSRGVRAKWDAMCGVQHPVTLREDVRSPNDDMTTPAIHLMAPDLQRAASLGKYLVAYFEDISSEHDVPSLFHIAAKYRLMKHFEELIFRIQDMEKYRPDCVNCVQGLGPDDYFRCPSGQALKDAVETFRDYQQQHPDWFEREVLGGDEGLGDETDPLLMLPAGAIPPILECQPLLNAGPPVLVHEVDVVPNDHPAQRVHELTPEINSIDAGGPVSVHVLDLDPWDQHLNQNRPGELINPPVYLLQPDVHHPLAGGGAENVPSVVCRHEPLAASTSYQQQLRAKPVEQEEASELSLTDEPFRNEEVPQPSLASVPASVCASGNATYNKPSLQALQKLLSLQQCLTPLDVPVPHELTVQPTPLSLPLPLPPLLLPPVPTPQALGSPYSSCSLHHQPLELEEDERGYEEQREAAEVGWGLEEEVGAGDGDGHGEVMMVVENLREVGMEQQGEMQEEVMVRLKPEEMEEEDFEKRRSRGSDQGYGSRETPTSDPPPSSSTTSSSSSSPPPSSPSPSPSLQALAALQQSLYLANPRMLDYDSWDSA